MNIIEDLGAGLLSGLAFGAVGIVILVIGYVVLDLLTPGKLSELIYERHNWNAAVLAGSNLLALGAVVTTAIATSHDEFAKGIADTAGYGLLGVLLLAISFVVIDRLTPGHLGTLLTADRPVPAVLVSAAATLAVGATVAASIA